MHRRRFAKLVGVVAFAPLWSCARSQPQPETIADLLGLEGAERAWIAQLKPDDRQDLLDALENPSGGRKGRAVDLMFSIVGDRSRLFSFVRYPSVNDHRAVCDGLLPE